MKIFAPFLLTLLITSIHSCGSDGPSEFDIKMQKRRDSIDAENKRLAQLRSDSLNYFNYVSDSLYEHRKTSDAIIYLDSALLYTTDDGEDTLYDKRAKYNMEKRNYDEAIIDYSVMISNYYNRTENLYNRGLLYKKKGKTELAVRDFHEAKKGGHEEAAKLHDRMNPEKKRVVRYITRCCDGSTSSSKGSGACSHHGGVCNWNEPVYETYRKYEFD